MKRILFVCVENSCRSQMAEGYARYFAKGKAEVYSAGSKPSGKVDDLAIKIMGEDGIDISGARSKGFNKLSVEKFDYSVSIGCKDVCPFVPSEKHIEWDIEDPKGKGIDVFMEVRNAIKEKVKGLMEEIFSGEEEIRGERKQGRYFDEELGSLNTALLKMAAMTEEAIFNSIEALKNRDKNMAKSVIENDSRIDEMELAIEEQAIDLLALRQPMAVDLRFITTGMKINAELERIADLAVNISQRVLETACQPLLKPLIDIPRLSELAGKMVRNAIDSFVNHDEKLAKKVIFSDTEVDNLKNLVQEELINDYMVKDGRTSPRAVSLLLVARHLERICDHATNIAEDVIYMVRAKVVKHHPEKLA